MALYETLIEGGHEHLIDAVKARIAQKADAIIEDELKPIIENQPSATLEGELLAANDAADLPPAMVGVDGKSTQVTTTGKNLFDPDKTPYGYYSGSTGAFVANNRYRWWSVPVAEGDVLRYANSADCIMTYWSNGEFVGSHSQTLGATYTVEAGIDEIRGYSHKNYNDRCIVTLNNANLTYEPYTGGAPSPSPDYPQEIVDVTDPVAKFARKNLLNPMDIESGYITGNGDSANSQQCRMATKIPVTPGTRYVASFSNSISYIAYFYANWNDSIRTAVSATLSSGTPFAVPSGCNYVRLTFGTPVGTLQDAQLELGPTATAYEPYAGTTVSLYDGTLRSLPDGTKDTLALSYLRPSTREGWAWYGRELVQRVHEITLNTCAWLPYSTTAFYTRGLNLPFTVGNVEVLCNIFKPSASKNLGGLANAEINSIQVLGRNELGIRTADEYQDAAAFVASLDDSDIAVVKLTTPVTTTLDPIELPVLPAPNATVWADPTANLNLTYVIDSKTIEESLESGIAKGFSSIAPVETSPATDNHAAGSRIVYNETLYKVTSAIAAGEDIVPGTNVTPTTVAAELLATQA